jgi:hypothetical protein
VVAPAAPAADAKPGGARPWKDVDDLEDDDDDPSEYLPTRVLGVPAPTSVPVPGQRTLVPPPPSRGAVRSRSPASFSLPAIPPPPTLPRSVAPSVPPVAFDWIRERASGRRGKLTLALGGLLILLVGVLPAVAFGAFVVGSAKRLFGSDNGGLVVTVAGTNHGPVDSSMIVVVDEVTRCQASPCRISDLNRGTHFVRVSAPGYQEMAPRAVSIEKGSEAALHIELARVPQPQQMAAREQPLDLDDPRLRAEAQPAARSEVTQPAATRAAALSNASASTSTRSASVGSEPGTLNLSSNPPSNVVLDGRPLGITPRAGIRVKPGAHQVVFIHPKHGRKSARANVKPGAVSNVSVRFR